MVNLTGAYVGIVMKNDDPEKLGRLKIRVPHAYGATGSEIGSISVDNLPWALPSGLPQGGSARSGAISWLPEPGDQVIVWFLDGEPEKPVWSWLMQTVSQAKGYAVNAYSDTGGIVGKPSRAVLTRYGHAIEFNSGSIIEATSGGYRFVIRDSAMPQSQDGQIQISTPKGNYIEIDDQTSTLTVLMLQDARFNITQAFTVLCEQFDVVTTNDDAAITSGAKIVGYALDNIELESGLDFKMTVGQAMTFNAATSVAGTAGTTLDLTAGASSSVTAPLVEIKGDITNLGTGVLQPIPGGTNLVSLLTTLITYLDTHIHSNGNNGSPTGTPIVPSTATITPLLPNLISKTVFGSL
jgi:hypothetical protein